MGLEMNINELPLPHIRQAAENIEVTAAMARFYAELEQRLAVHQPQCHNRGLCCKFGTYGHRLYVTALELAYFIAHHRTELSQADGSGGTVNLLEMYTSPESRNCPFQQGGLCTTRAGRSMGCRVFFCSAEGESWPAEISEWGLQQLRTLHHRFAVPYVYVEWLTALAALRKDSGFTAGELDKN
ncbi:MAG: hypothetical protein HJJLKODD_00821 [Phycisphaerae bacterium]|nr:hypothetical protein [Phycisphaerae bacterium]